MLKPVELEYLKLAASEHFCRGRCEAGSRKPCLLLHHQNRKRWQVMQEAERLDRFQ